MDCVFCKIIKGEIPSFKVWENDNFLAILDINPNTKGMTLVLSKEHYDSYAFDMPENIYEKFLLAGKKVAKVLEKGLDVQRVAMVMEGMGVNHAHIKLYPLYGLEEKFKEMWAKEKIFLDKYPGYLTTQLGPQADFEELKQLAEKLKSDDK
jgi:diadenosine tetraphosphate (Ap4A) HIT family hydrolase